MPLFLANALRVNTNTSANLLHHGESINAISFKDESDETFQRTNGTVCFKCGLKSHLSNNPAWPAVG